MGGSFFGLRIPASEQNSVLRRLPGRASNAEKQPTGPGPEGCDENGPAAALLIGHESIQICSTVILGVQAENLESRHVAFFPASFELVAVGANNRHTQMFPLSAVGIYPERFVRDLERLSRASKMSDDFGNVGVSAVGTINCTDDLSVVVVMPSIFVSIPGRRPRWIFRLRIGAHRTQEGQQDR